MNYEEPHIHYIDGKFQLACDYIIISMTSEEDVNYIITDPGFPE